MPRLMAVEPKTAEGQAKVLAGTDVDFPPVALARTA